MLRLLTRTDGGRMAESGLAYFLAALQESITPKQPKRKVRVFLPAIPEQPVLPNQDYTGAVCLLHSLTELYPIYREVLVDADDMERLSAFQWRLARCGR